MTTKLKITLIKSLIGRLPKHIETVHALGLKRINRMVEKHDTPTIRGMLNKVSYLLKIEEYPQ